MVFRAGRGEDPVPPVTFAPGLGAAQPREAPEPFDRIEDRPVLRLAVKAGASPERFEEGPGYGASVHARGPQGRDPDDAAISEDGRVAGARGRGGRAVA